MDLVPLYLEPEPLNSVGGFIAVLFLMYFMVRENKEVNPDKKIMALLKGVFWFFTVYTLSLLLALKANFVLHAFDYPPRINEISSRPSPQDMALYLLQTKREIERINVVVSYFIFSILGCFVLVYMGVARIVKEKIERGTSAG
jgi:hypothetical protein